MNFVIGFMIIFVVGMASILGLGTVLESNGYSENQIIFAKCILAFFVIAIPPLLVVFGGRNQIGETKIEELGKPITFLSSLIGSSLYSPTNIIIFILIIIVNILVWK